MQPFMQSLIEQIKARRLALDLKQHDMMHRVGMSRQQYQRLESKGNPRLDTLELVSRGLNCELLLIPQEKLSAVMAVLSDESVASAAAGWHTRSSGVSAEEADPWEGLLGEDE
jgi:transcriptional regulator with XRE-family HTH domain